MGLPVAELEIFVVGKELGYLEILIVRVRPVGEDRIAAARVGYPVVKLVGKHDQFVIFGAELLVLVALLFVRYVDRAEDVQKAVLRIKLVQLGIEAVIFPGDLIGVLTVVYHFGNELYMRLCRFEIRVVIMHVAEAYILP